MKFAGVMPAKAGIHTDSTWTRLSRSATSPGRGCAVRGTAHLLNFAGVTGERDA